MITKNNLRQVMDELSKSDIDECMYSSKDYVAFEVHVSNGGFTSHAKPADWSANLNRELFNNGNMLIDKDEFLRLAEECGTTNPYFKAYI